jgi:DNA-binding MarR family transcriptional regulator
MSSSAFLKMIEAYRNTFGSAYPRQDIAAVISVFRECAKEEATTQDRIRQTTGLAAGNLSKIVKRGCEKGWIRPAASRGADGTKQVSLTPKGRKTLEDLEARWAEACSDSATTIQTAKAATRAAGKTSSRWRSEKPRTRSEDLWTAVGLRPDGTKTSDGSGEIG